MNHEPQEQAIQDLAAPTPVVPQNPWAQAGTILGGFGASATGGINRPLEMFQQQQQQESAGRIQALQLGMKVREMRERKEETVDKLLKDMADSPIRAVRAHAIPNLFKRLERHGLKTDATLQGMLIDRPLTLTQRKDILADLIAQEAGGGLSDDFIAQTHDIDVSQIAALKPILKSEAAMKVLAGTTPTELRLKSLDEGAKLRKAMRAEKYPEMAGDTLFTQIVEGVHKRTNSGKTYEQGTLATQGTAFEEGIKKWAWMQGQRALAVETAKGDTPGSGAGLFYDPRTFEAMPAMISENAGNLLATPHPQTGKRLAVRVEKVDQPWVQSSPETVRAIDALLDAYESGKGTYWPIGSGRTDLATQTSEKAIALAGQARLRALGATDPRMAAITSAKLLGFKIARFMGSNSQLSDREREISNTAIGLDETIQNAGTYQTKQALALQMRRALAGELQRRGFRVAPYRPAALHMLKDGTMVRVFQDGTRQVLSPQGD